MAKPVRQHIIDEVNATLELLDSNKFVGDNHKTSKPGVLVLNNSFINREETSTTKSRLYLCAPLCPVPGVVDTTACAVAQFGGKHKNDKDQRLEYASVQTHPLTDAIKGQKKGLGRLIFTLIGELDKNQPAEVEVKHGDIKLLRFSPGIASPVVVDSANKTASIQDFGDLIGLEKSIEKALGKPSDPKLRDALNSALERLQAEAVVKVKAAVRDAGDLPRSLLGELSGTLSRQAGAYSKALAAWKATTNEAEHNDVLRIAYTFATDALKLIQLLVSVADLKPIILWMTLSAHVDFAKTFQSLPWVHSCHKPTLSGYQAIIADARNSAFHRFFSFNRTLDVDVDGVSFRATHLKLALPYGTSTKQREEAFGFEDQKLVSLLRESFFRSRERKVEYQFLEVNEQVIAKTQALVDRTASALLLLRGAW